MNPLANSKPVSTSNVRVCQTCQTSEEKLSETNKKIMRCGKCKIAFYCSRECQTIDRSAHKSACNKHAGYQTIIKINPPVPAGNSEYVVPQGILTIVDSSGLAPPMERDKTNNYANEIKKTKTEQPVVVDIGCGRSIQAIDLLRQGWKVICVDKSQQLINLLIEDAKKANRIWLEQNQLIPKCEQVEDFEWPAHVDLIVASNSLPFFNPSNLEELMDNIYRALNPGGYFIGNFYCANLIGDQKKQTITRELMNVWLLHNPSQGRTLLQNQGYHIIESFETNEENPFAFVFFCQKPNTEIEELTQATNALTI